MYASAELHQNESVVCGLPSVRCCAVQGYGMTLAYGAILAGRDAGDWVYHLDRRVELFPSWARSSSQRTRRCIDPDDAIRAARPKSPYWDHILNDFVHPRSMSRPLSVCDSRDCVRYVHWSPSGPILVSFWSLFALTAPLGLPYPFCSQCWVAGRSR
jgi:hypothetical protein